MYGLSPGARPCVPCAGGRAAQPAGGLRPGPGVWVAAGCRGGGGAMRCGARGGRGAVWADQLAAGGGPESPTPWGWRARRGHARRAGLAVGSACARALARPMRAPLRAAGPAASWKRALGAEAWAGRVGSGGQPRRWRRHAGAGPVAAAGLRRRTGWWSAAALRARLHGVSVHVGGGGGLWAGGRPGARGGRGCSELSRRAAPCGRPGGGAAGAGQSRPGRPGRSRCRRGRGQRWGPHPAQRERIPPSIIHGGESPWRRGGAPRRPLAVEPDRDGPRRRATGGAGWAGHRGSEGRVPGGCGPARGRPGRPLGCGW